MNCHLHAAVKRSSTLAHFAHQRQLNSRRQFRRALNARRSPHGQEPPCARLIRALVGRAVARGVSFRGPFDYLVLLWTRWQWQPVSDITGLKVSQMAVPEAVAAVSHR